MRMMSEKIVTYEDVEEGDLRWALNVFGADTTASIAHTAITHLPTCPCLAQS